MPVVYASLKRGLDPVHRSRALEEIARKDRSKSMARPEHIRCMTRIVAMNIKVDGLDDTQ